VAAGAVMCFFGISVAFPQVFAPSSIRFNLISEIRTYNDDGLFIIRELRASTEFHGREVILQRDIPGDTLMTLHMHFFDTIHRWFDMNSGAPSSISSDCSVPGASVTGHETVIGYRTTVLQYPPLHNRGRYREWRAPELDCITMKWVEDEPTANGEFRMTGERWPLTVRMNHAQ
jgi:hypothetical protein